MVIVELNTEGVDDLKKQVPNEQGSVDKVSGNLDASLIETIRAAFEGGGSFTEEHKSNTFIYKDNGIDGVFCLCMNVSSLENTSNRRVLLDKFSFTNEELETIKPNPDTQVSDETETAIRTLVANF